MIDITNYMKTNKERTIILDQLRKTPIVQIACEKTGIARATYYRWRKQSKKFKKESDKAIIEGRFMINDLAESQLINAIKDKNFGAIKFWLNSHHIDYKSKVEITHRDNDIPLTKEQKTLIRRALKFTSAHKKKNHADSTKNNRKDN